ncbi:TolB family protein [Gemmatimonadota bacterium]
MCRYGRGIFKLFSTILTVFLVMVQGCDKTATEGEEEKVVPREGRYGVYSLDLLTESISLIYSTPAQVFTSSLSLNSRGDSLVFAQAMDCTDDTCLEIAVVGVDGGGLRRVTTNQTWDLYPVWSPDDSRIAFLSWREADLDIYVVNADGTSEVKLFDSGSHDADIHWKGDKIVFTSGCRIWSMKGDGTSATALTNPPRVCEWGNANLPFGDYDPRLSHDGMDVVFERLEDDTSPHGNYNLYRVDSDGSDETRLTSTGYAQGLASWSYSGDEVVFTVSAIEDVGKYRLYMMDADGTNNRDITPSYFPPEFLCHAAIFSRDDSRLLFIGEWWG